jgi:hypothetical protein
MAHEQASLPIINVAPLFEADAPIGKACEVVLGSPNRR